MRLEAVRQNQVSQTCIRESYPTSHPAKTMTNTLQMHFPIFTLYAAKCSADEANQLSCNVSACLHMWTMKLQDATSKGKQSSYKHQMSLDNSVERCGNQHLPAGDADGHVYLLSCQELGP